MNDEQTPALREAVENMANMREAYDNLSQAAEAYNTGKTELAANITSKGVEASATETLPELAEKVSAISQETYQINGGEMYAKQLFGSLETPNFWNLYEVLANLLSDGRLVSYGGILLAEYYRGYDSLALSGAGSGGAYVVSDLDENGQFKMYTEDTTHTWATEFDGKGNRWVAYCFADEYHDFQITNTDTSPRSIFIGRKVGTITSLINTRISQIVVPDGNELQDIDTHEYSSAFGRHIRLRNVNNLTHSLFNNFYPDSLYIECKNITLNSTYLIYTRDPISNPAGMTAMIKADTYTGNNSELFSYRGAGIIILDIKNIRGQISADTSYDNACKELYICNVIDIDNIPYYYHLLGGQWTSLYKLYVSHGDIEDKTKVLRLSSNKVRQAGTDVQFREGFCQSTNVSQFIQDEPNMYAHILQRLKQDEPDCGDGVTITLGSTNLAKLTSQESVDLLDALTNTYGYTFA